MHLSLEIILAPQVNSRSASPRRAYCYNGQMDGQLSYRLYASVDYLRKAMHVFKTDITMVTWFLSTSVTIRIAT